MSNALFRNAGMSLQNDTRDDIGLPLTMERIYGANVTVTDQFIGSSPPIGHELLTESGIDLSVKPRTFFFKKEYTGDLGEPQIGDIITDVDAGSRWKVLPQGGTYAWRWHGSDMSAYSVMTEQET